MDAARTAAMRYGCRFIDSAPFEKYDRYDYYSILRGRVETSRMIWQMEKNMQISWKLN